MNFQEAHENGKNDLVARIGLSYLNLEMRLLNYFTYEEVKDILFYARFMQYWSNGNIAIVYTGNGLKIDEYVVVADGNYMKLIEP